MFPNAAPEGVDLTYLPYWRFKGMLFSCLPGGIEHKFMDLSHQAVQSTAFPVSLGFRSQTLKLQFVSPDTEGRFLKPTFPLPEVMEIFDRRFSGSLPKPILHQAHIGESISLIYSPCYMKNDRLYDGILNEPVQGSIPPDFDLEALAGGPPDWKTKFVPTLCPSCGWDLDGERDAMVLFCRNCTSAWQGAKDGLKQIPFSYIPREEEDTVYFPFWRVRASTSGIPLENYADLVKAANLPKAVQDGWEDIEFRYWEPAFKVRPRTLLRLASTMTCTQPQDKRVKEIPEGRMYAVNLPITEAIENLKTNLAGFLKPKQFLVENLPDIEIKASGFSLVYVPFVEKHHDLVHPSLHLSINRNQLALSGNL
jgi:hypothetical protein